MLTPFRILGALALVVVTDTAGTPRDIVGQWRGTSICVKAEWNSACNDEQIVYDFVAGADSDHVLQHASKIVNGIIEPMGDLPAVYDAGHAQWNADFENSRVKIRWSYRVTGDSLAGEVTLMPSGRIGRHVVAKRQR